jgi:hypothetical protein
VLSSFNVWCRGQDAASKARHCRNTNVGLFGVLFLVAFLLYIFSIFAGYKLIKLDELGIHYSKINQLLQLIFFATLGCGYSFVSGFKFVIGIDATTDVRLFYRYSLSDWRFMINPSNESNYFGINIIALILVILLEKLFREINSQDSTI